MIRSTVLAALGVCSVPKTKVTGVGSHDREFDGFQIAQLTDEHDVRVFAERAFKTGGEPFGVQTDFALVDQAVLLSCTNSIGLPS